MKILILGGAGMMGSGTVRDLVSVLSAGVSEVHVADTTSERVGALVESLGDPRLTAHTMDVADGAAPGMSNMICKAVAEELDTIDRINLYWAATADGPANPVLVPPYAVSTVLAEYALPSQQFIEGGLREVPAMSGHEVIELPAPWGTTEFIHSIHSEPLTVPFAAGIAEKGIREFTWKLSLPQQEHDTWAALIRVGFRDFEDPIEIGGVAIKPDDYLARLIARNMERHAEEIPEQAGHEIHFADGAGTKDGQPHEIRCAITSGPDPLYDDYLDAGTSMNVSIAAQLLLNNPQKPGVWGPEEYFEVEPYFAELEKRHFDIHRSG